METNEDHSGNERESRESTNKSKNENFNQNKKPRFRQKHDNVKKGRLIIRNLSFKATEEIITNEFQKHGTITEVNVLKKSDGKLVGCAFVQYEKYEDSIKAIKNLNGKDFLKRKITVDFAVSKDRYKKSHETDDKPEIKTEDDEIDVKDEIKEEEDGREVKEEDDDSEGEDDDYDDDEKPTEDEKKEMIKKDRKSNEADLEFTIFVKNLSFETSNEDLHQCFKKYGPIKYALVVRDSVSGHSKGTGFVRFLKKESVNMCLQQTGLITLQNYTLEIFPSLTKNKIKSLETDKKKPEQKDTRNMYLLREGMVIAGSAAANGVSATDMSKRLRLEQVKSSMLKNLNRFISQDRLTIHNLPEVYDDDKMRKMVIARTQIKPIECRVMRENQPSPAFPQGKPKGFGFLSFKRHEDALTVLRKLNNNPDIFSSNHRPIVSFSIEDKKVLNIKERRQKRSLENNPTYQKKLEKIKLKKAKKLKIKNDKKPQVATKPQGQKPAVEENADEFSGFAAKPGAFVKLRGTFKLREQSKIHEKSMHDRNKIIRKEKQLSENRKEKEQKKLEKNSKKRKIDPETHDSLSKMINKYKDMVGGRNDDDGPDEKRVKTRGKWFMD